MNMLEILSIDNECASRSTHLAFDDLLSSLHMPNLTRYKCKLAPTQPNYTPEYHNHLESFLNDNVSTVQDFSVEFSSSVPLNWAFTPTTIFRSLPKLRSLSVTYATLPSSLVIYLVKTPPLCAIKFARCFIPNKAFLEELTTATGTAPYLDGCIDISWERVDWISDIMPVFQD
jgi:hypothetical protein